MSTGRRPNVLLLFADQHKASVMGCEGHPDVATPQLDRLAADGTRFARAYCQDAVCVPSRCSLFTGLYPRTLGCLANGDRSPVMDQVVSLQQALRANGYATAAFGKRHLYQACDAGWDIQASHLHVESPADNYVDWIRERGLMAPYARDWAAEFGCGPEDVPEHAQVLPFALMSARASALPEDATMEAWTAQRTIAYLKAQGERGQPFFCWSSFYRPHQPYTALPRYLARFDRSRWGRGARAGDGLAMPASLRQPLDALPPLFREQHAGKNRIWRFDLARADEQLYRDGMAAYYALVEEIDHHVGSILGALEEAGLARDTIVIYAADHGDFVGAHGMLEKCAAGHNVYEETLRVPLIVRWPGHVRAGAVSADLVELVDLYPTLLALCGCARPACAWPLQGLSLAPALRDGAAAARAFSVSENASQATIVTRRWKLGAWQANPGAPAQDYRGFGDQLFDREGDPLELQNRFGEAACEGVRRELADQLAAWQRATPRCAPR